MFMCTKRRVSCALVAVLASFLAGCSLNSAGSGGGSGGGGGGGGEGSGSHSVSLTWKASTSGNVVGYNVYRGSSSGSYGLLNSMNSTTSYTDTTVQNGQTYSYVVTAVDSTGAESPHSNVAEAVIP
jgi:TolB protein